MLVGTNGTDADGGGRRRGLAGAIVLTILAAAVIASGCAGRGEPARSVDRHEALVEIGADGSVLVTERLDGQLFGGSATFERVIAGERADVIDYAGSSPDGVNWVNT